MSLTFDNVIDEFVLEYRPGKSDDGLPFFGPDNPTSQFIRIHDVSFTAVPEPSALLYGGAAAALVGIGYRRRRR